MDYVVALSGSGDIELIKVKTKYLDDLVEELECEGKIFMVIDNDKYIKDDMLCLNITDIYEGEK